MKAKGIEKRTRPPRRAATDWARVDALTDREIEKAIRSDPDAAPMLDREWFRKAKVVLPQRKAPISLRLHPDVIRWFKSLGPRYQSRMNAVLRAYMEARRKAE
jgi:uncharacterized protein (DUF4415 family)